MKILGMTLLTLMLGCGQKDIQKIKPIINPLPDDRAQNDEEPRREIPLCKTYCEDKNNIISEWDKFDYLSFTNFGFRGIGRCRGHAIITQQLSQLIHYDNSTKCLGGNCVDIALESIKMALNFKAVTIKGFKNLYELSAVPRIEAYLKMRVRSISHKYSARGIEVDERYSDQREINLFYYIKDQVILGHRPYIAIKGVNIGHHALLAYEHSQNHHGEVICVKDSNYIPKNGLECKSYLFIQDEAIYYKRADLEPRMLFIFNVMTDDLMREQKYLKTQRNYCLANAHKNGLCRL